MCGDKAQSKSNVSGSFARQMTTIHPTLTPWLAGLRGLGRPASRSGPGGFGLFFKPSADGFTRHSKRAFQPAQGATFCVGVENPRFFGVTVTGCRGIFAAHTLAVATPEPLFLIAREPVTNKLFAFTKPAFECDRNHKQHCARSNLTYPLPVIVKAAEMCQSKGTNRRFWRRF